MKTLVIISIIMTSCGGAEDLANAINNASATHKSGTSGANQPAPTSSTVTTAETTTSSSATSSTTTTVTTTGSAASGNQSTETNTTALSDILDGTSWNTDCENGLSYKVSFAKGVETTVTQIYQDSDCKVLSQAVPQKTNYAIDGDDIQFGIGKAGEFKIGPEYHDLTMTMTMVNNTLSFSGNADQIYHKISK